MKLMTSVLFGAAVSEEVCLKYWNNVNFSGDLIEQPKKVSNFEECGQACFSNNDCKERINSEFNICGSLKSHQLKHQIILFKKQLNF